MERQFDTAVVGGGAAGLASAIGLAQAGLRTLVLGVPDSPHDDGRSAALFESSLAFLDRLGVGDALRARGAPLRAIRLIDVTGALVRAPTVTFKAAELGQDCFGWNIPNAAIVAVLAEAARAIPGLTVSAALLDGFEVDGGEARLRIAGGGEMAARLVIGADGQRSRVRAAAGIGFREKPYPQAAITCRLAHPRDHEDVSLEFHTREGPFTFVPVGERRSALVWIMRPEKAEAMLALSRAEFAARITRAAMSILGAVTIEGPVAAVPMRKLVADRLTAPRVALVGEAAHAFPPIGAQGLNLGLKDVEALVGMLAGAHARGEDPAAALPAYARARRMDVELRSAGVDLLNSALIAGRFPVDLARALGLAALRDLAPLRRLAMRIGGWNPPFGSAVGADGAGTR
ncbi:FAD-dependent monooxygenase [Rhabdaerophilum calidifontis]|uniref:FAD-dependent monooxygenase n=1 Tax=Rhabdaerophilum calidifontis TaxID=2604328 RepID=UPI00123AFBA6|nr:FAD-dependent monooxygenase [Rhabdaerophilum calidifontis]